MHENINFSNDNKWRRRSRRIRMFPGIGREEGSSSSRRRKK